MEKLSELTEEQLNDMSRGVSSRQEAVTGLLRLAVIRASNRSTFLSWVMIILIVVQLLANLDDILKVINSAANFYF